MSTFPQLEPPGLRPAAFTYYRKLYRLKEYVEKNSARPISLKEAASHVGLQPAYFSTYFHRRTGVRFCDWLAAVRIEHAASLLTHSDLSVTWVAQMIGFHDVTTFERTFKKVTHMTPSSFRHAFGDAYQPADGHFPEKMPLKSE